MRAAHPLHYHARRAGAPARAGDARVSLRSAIFKANKAIATQMASSCASIFMPAPCRVCGEPLDNASPLPICDTCVSEITPVPAPFCASCGRPLPFAALTPHSPPFSLSGAPLLPSLAASPTLAPVPPPASPPLCRLCHRGVYAFASARSYAIYNDALRGAVLLLKYEQLTRLGGWFAARLAALARREYPILPFDAVVPVPIDPARRRERGYNQAELIAGPLAHLLHLPLEAALLARTHPRPSKLLLSRRERWTSVRGAFATRHRAQVDNLRILLVDDVLTTGATLDACARALLQAGALSVCGLTVARIIPQSSGLSLGHPTASNTGVSSVSTVGLDHAPASNSPNTDLRSRSPSA